MPAALDTLDMGHWCFYVLSRERLKEVTKDGKSVSPARLEKLGVAPVQFKGIPKALASAR